MDALARRTIKLEEDAKEHLGRESLEIEFLNIYEWYDGPRFFSCKDQDGTIYLVYFFHGDIKQGIETYLFAPISQDKLTQLETGAIDMFTALRTVEETCIEVYLYLMKHERRGEIVATDVLDMSLIEDEELPEPGQYVEVEDFA